MEFTEIIALLGGILSVLGLLLLGLATGWFTVFAFRQPERHWQLQVAVYLGMFLFIALLIRYSTPGGVGGFGLGFGAALLIWGLRGEPSEEEDA
jgi:hypothetical protein